MPEGLYRASMLLKLGFPLKHCGNDNLADVAYIVAGVIFLPLTIFPEK